MLVLSRPARHLPAKYATENAGGDYSGLVANITNQTKRKRAWSTNVFLKQLMAVSGILFVLFILLHMYGNLKYLAGQAAYDEYAAHLRSFGEPILPHEGLLWILRVGLLIFLALHLYSAITLWLTSGRARGSRYEVKRSLAVSYAARTMRWGGVIILCFVCFHLLQFTTLTIQVGGEYHHGQAYDMMTMSFSNWYMVLMYAIAVGSVSMHIGHGVWSALQTLGWLRRNTLKPVMVISGLVGLGVFGGFMLPPVVIFITSLM